MINDIAPKGRASLPEKLKVEVFNRLRQGAHFVSVYAMPMSLEQDLRREAGHAALVSLVTLL